MTTANLLLQHDRVVTLDHGQFCLVGIPGRSGDHLAHLDAAGATGIAGDDYAVVVCPPHQNNFAMPLRVEVWDGPPPDDATEWDEVFRCGLLVGGDGLSYQSTTGQEVGFAVPSGAYSVSICGRGFVNRGWPGSTTPGDVWRVRMWPCTDRPAPARTRMWPPGP